MPVQSVNSPCVPPPFKKLIEGDVCCSPFTRRRSPSSFFLSRIRAHPRICALAVADRARHGTVVFKWPFQSARVCLGMTQYSVR